MKRIATAIVIVLFAVLFDNCSTDMKICTQIVPDATLAAVPQTKLASDLIIIDNYLTTNNIQNVIKESGIRYVITTVGAGQGPCLESKVSVTYTGRILKPDGTIGITFDTAIDPVVFQLNTLILGWQVGFLKLNKGASATLYIPSGYGYGAISSGKIPANSNLIFDVTLVDHAN